MNYDFPKGTNNTATKDLAAKTNDIAQKIFDTLINECTPDEIVTILNNVRTMSKSYYNEKLERFAKDFEELKELAGPLFN